MSVESVSSMPRLAKRPAHAYKGMFGHVLVIAGSRGMSGAAALAGASALRSGAGLVSLASPADAAAIAATFEPCYMTLHLVQDEQGRIAFPESAAALAEAVDKADVLALGPGLGRSEALAAMVRWILEAVDLPTVIDADGLGNLEGLGRDPFQALKRPVVMTPHPGEFARLTGTKVAEVQNDREGQAVRFAACSEHLTVVLKGHGTIVTDGRRVYRNETGNPGMATGGSGDVLTGVIAALLGQGLGAFEAAQLGTYVHGLAGDLAREQTGMTGMIAGDLVDSLPDAFHVLEQADG